MLWISYLALKLIYWKQVFKTISGNSNAYKQDIFERIQFYKQCCNKDCNVTKIEA